MNGRQAADKLGITAETLIDAVTLNASQRRAATKKLIKRLRDFDVPVQDLDNVFGGYENALIMVTTLSKKEFQQYLQDLRLI